MVWQVNEEENRRNIQNRSNSVRRMRNRITEGKGDNVTKKN